MLLWLLQRLHPLLNSPEGPAGGDPRVFLTARIALAALTSFLAALLFGPGAIRWLKSQRVGERIEGASQRLNELHAGKQDTPTMGGVFVVLAIVVSAVLWADLHQLDVQIGLAVTISFAALGAIDDYIKLTTRRRGLQPRSKFLAQLVLGVLACGALVLAHQGNPGNSDVAWPVGHRVWSLGRAYVLWGTLVLVGSSNGVNLTDGLDGLAAGCTVFAGAAVCGLAYLAGHRVLAGYFAVPHLAGAGELAVLASALVGATLGFLWFNAHPAAVFMGDTGSLPLGATLGYISLAIKQEVLLAVIGGVFVAEALSVIVQVGCYKLTGRRVLACSPLHHHFQFRGMSETKVVVRLWIVAALLAIAALASLNIH